MSLTGMLKWAMPLMSDIEALLDPGPGPRPRRLATLKAPLTVNLLGGMSRVETDGPETAALDRCRARDRRGSDHSLERREGRHGRGVLSRPHHRIDRAV